MQVSYLNGKYRIGGRFLYREFSSYLQAKAYIEQPRSTGIVRHALAGLTALAIKPITLFIITSGTLIASM